MIDASRLSGALIKAGACSIASAMTASEMSSSTSGGDFDGEDADRSLTNSASSDSVRTAVRKKSVGAGMGEDEEDELVVPSLAKMPARPVERATTVQVE